MGNAQLRYQTMGLDDSRQMELLRQQLQMQGMQQQGNIGYEGAQQRKAGAEYAYNAAQPSQWDKFMGAAQGAGQGYMAMNAGAQPQGVPQGGGYMGTSDPNKSHGGGSY
jgi:hypothetical protein